MSWLDIITAVIFITLYQLVYLNVSKGKDVCYQGIRDCGGKLGDSLAANRARNLKLRRSYIPWQQDGGLGGQN